MALSQLIGIAWASPAAILLCAGCAPSTRASARPIAPQDQLIALSRSEGEPLRINGGGSFDLGIVEKGGRRTAIVWLENSSSRDVHVQAASASCECIKLFVASESIPHHGRVPLAIQFADGPEDGFTGALAVDLTLTDTQGRRHSVGAVNLLVSSDEDIQAVWQLASNGFEDVTEVVSPAAE